MPLAPGTRVGVYEVAGSLGTGGMGEVYRARDPALGREVALKLLPTSFAADPERRARLAREARLLAALNHPNIATIYGLEDASGSFPHADGEVHALVLELVEGHTLAERIVRGPLPVDEAVAIAKQLAAGLDAAHQQGIVHRDLKPGNVKIRPDGTAKILDFGLAKALAEHDAMGESEVATRPDVTRFGVVIGTAAYMSPEQARGLPVDKRGDIWAFGCVLFEMLTGRRAFAGDDASDTMAAILRSDPDWDALPPELPARLRALLARCLAKDPARRLRDIGDARLELEEPLAPDVAPTPDAGARPARRAVLPWALAAALAGIVAGASIGALRTPAAPPTRLLEMTTPASLDPFSLSLSPDGRAMAFVAAGDGQPRLWVRRLDQANATLLPGTEGAQYPFWSPDGTALGFFADGQLKRIDRDGGRLRSLVPAAPGGGGAWGPNDTILFAPQLGSPLYRISGSGGEPQVVTQILEGQFGHRFPQFLPDGRFLFYAFGERGAPTAGGIYLGSLDDPEATHRVTAADGAGLYMEPGWLLFVDRGALLARLFDVGTAALHGPAFAIAENVETNDASTRSFSAAEGVIAYVPWSTPSRLTWFDRDGRELGTLGAADDNDLMDPEISPDGTRVAVSRKRLNDSDVWIFDATRGTRFTLEASSEQLPVWSPDGRELLLQSNRDGWPELYVGSATSPGLERPVAKPEGPSPQRRFPSDWSPDGSAVLFFAVSGTQSLQARLDMWVLPLVGEREPYPWLETAATEVWGQFSPDGQFVAYHSNESGAAHEVYVRRFAEPQHRWLISAAGGVYPRWSRDGKELYYIAPDRSLIAVPIEVRGTDLVVGNPRPLFQTRIIGGGRNVVGRRHQYDVAPDGRFLINVERDDAQAPAIKLLLNWRAR